MPFKEKSTRTCKRCKREMDKYKYFYSPTCDVCITCEPDVKFIRQSRKIARAQGVEVLKERLADYNRRAELTREALRSLERKEA
jgi:hypothetical protein